MGTACKSRRRLSPHWNSRERKWWHWDALKTSQGLMKALRSRHWNHFPHWEPITATARTQWQGKGKDLDLLEALLGRSVHLLCFDEYLHRNTIHRGGRGSFLFPQLVSQNKSSLLFGILIYLGFCAFRIPIHFEFCLFKIPFTWDPQSFRIPIPLWFCSFVILIIWNPICLAFPFI